MGYVGWRARSGRTRKRAAVEPAQPRKTSKSLHVEPLAVEVGLGLVRWWRAGRTPRCCAASPAFGGRSRRSWGTCCRRCASPTTLALGREYVVLLKGAEIARYELAQGCELAIRRLDPPTGGRQTREPAFGMPHGGFRPKPRTTRAAGTPWSTGERTGYAPVGVDPRHAHELFSRQDAKKLLDRVADENPKVVEDLVPKLVPLAMVQRVLQNLLRERVSIRDAVSILEAPGRPPASAAIPCC